MIRLTIFIIALLLAIGAMAPTGPWLVTLAVLAGIELVRWRRPGRLFRLRGWFGRRWAEEFNW
jgi:hypothetical protein